VLEAVTIMKGRRILLVVAALAVTIRYAGACEMRCSNTCERMCTKPCKVKMPEESCDNACQSTCQKPCLSQCGAAGGTSDRIMDGYYGSSDYGYLFGLKRMGLLRGPFGMRLGYGLPYGMFGRYGYGLGTVYGCRDLVHSCRQWAPLGYCRVPYIATSCCQSCQAYYKKLRDEEDE